MCGGGGGSGRVVRVIWGEIYRARGKDGGAGRGGAGRSGAGAVVLGGGKHICV